MAWFYKTHAEADFIQEITSLSDRLVGILAPIILEERLKSAIQHRWVDNNIKGGTTILKDLFQPSGEIGSLGTKIRVGLAVGLYGQESHADLVRIEKARNAFAHRLDIKRFDEPPVVDHIRELKITTRWPDSKPLPLTLGEHSVVILEPEDEPDFTSRGIFLKSVQIFCNLLYHESHVRRNDPRTPVF